MLCPLVFVTLSLLAQESCRFPSPHIFGNFDIFVCVHCVLSRVIREKLRQREIVCCSGVRGRPRQQPRRMGDVGESKLKDEFVVDDDDDDDGANDDDDVDEEVRRSYVEVNGPVPTGPVVDGNGLAQQVVGGPIKKRGEGVALIGLAKDTGAPAPAAGKSATDRLDEHAPGTTANESANEPASASARLKKRGSTRVALVGLTKPAAAPAPAAAEEMEKEDTSTAEKSSRVEEAPVPAKKLSYQEVHGAIPTGPVINENGLAQQVSGAAAARPQPVIHSELQATPTLEAKPSVVPASAPRDKATNAHIARLGHAVASDAASPASTPGCRCVSGTTSPGGTFYKTARAYVHAQRAVRGQQVRLA